MNPTNTEASPLAPSHLFVRAPDAGAPATLVRAPQAALRPWAVLLLLLTSYGLVLLAPVAFNTLRIAAAGIGQPIRVAEWVPVALAIGLALLGGAAMVTVLKRLVSGLEFHPYTGVAAAFGVLMGSALIALRAPFHLGMLDSGACAVLCLLASITGAALALRPRFTAVIAGAIVALAPAPLLVVVFWASTDSSQSVQGLLHGLPAADRTFLGLIALFGLLLWLVAVSSRGARPGPARAFYAGGMVREPSLDELDMELAIPLTRPRASTQLPALERASTSVSDFALAPTIVSPHLEGRPGTHETPPSPVVMPPSLASDPSTRISVWSFHDAPPKPEDFEFPELRGSWNRWGLWCAIVVAAALAVATYVWRFSH